ncbi:MAG TPA: hypothetical protein VMT30_08065 [Candidatus Saccharimonadia bacterium]|nr:hypothetical protein [Candidatus Saccharimonadia bacterium]
MSEKESIARAEVQAYAEDPFRTAALEMAVNAKQARATAAQYEKQAPQPFVAGSGDLVGLAEAQAARAEAARDRLGEFAVEAGNNADIAFSYKVEPTGAKTPAAAMQTYELEQAVSREERALRLAQKDSKIPGLGWARRQLAKKSPARIQQLKEAIHRNLGGN